MVTARLPQGWQLTRAACFSLILVCLLVTVSPGREEGTVPDPLKNKYSTQQSSFQPNVLRTTLDGQPLIRIGLLEGYEKIDFRVKGQFRITKLDGSVILSNHNSDLKWRSKPEGTVQTARFTYSVLAEVGSNELEAQQLCRKYEQKGVAATLQKIGGSIVVNNREVGNNTRYRILIGSYSREHDAIKAMSHVETTTPRVVRSRLAGTIGRIEVYDSEAIVTEIIDLGFRIEPEENDTETTLFAVKIGSGFQWEKEEDRTYRGAIEIRFDNEGKMEAINELSLDDYIEGVLPSEMPSDFPLEALKAQAVAARSETLSKVGTKHINDHYHLCAHVHCQVYSGVTRRIESASRAVQETRGELMRWQKELVEASYCSNSGGHTENRENVWAAPPVPYLTGKVDSDDSYRKKFKLDLRREEDARSWIDSKPTVYSNPAGITQVASLMRLAKNFRWEVTISRRDLEEIMRKKLGEDIGTVYDIVPIVRGVSGRIIEIEFLGSRRNLRVKKELAIRRALSSTALQSSCFYVTAEVDRDGVPTEFTFKGAGFGHGVGMCQTGAAVMALKKKTYLEILKQYYPGAVVERLFDGR
ncbi:MAG: SpoIID/LytB domain-containing protein [bacterium]|nr:SpoIID/LytB domain-containing protein [bacterium]